MMKYIPRQRAKLLSILWACALCLAFMPRSTSAQANFTYNTFVTYRVQADDSTEVTERYTITNNTPRLYLSELKLTTPTSNLTDLSVSYEDGGSIPAKSIKQKSTKGDIDFESSLIDIKFPKPIFGESRKWTFIVKYKAKGLAESRGGSHTVFIPSIDPAEGTDSYSVRLEVPVGFGNPHFTGAKAVSSGVDDGMQYFTFGRNELMKQSLALAFGDINRYKLNFNFPLQNTSPFPRTITVALPPDLNNQKVYINRLMPAPNKTRLDEDGNVLADYKLDAGQRIVVSTDVVGEVRQRDYDLGKSGFKKDIPADLAKKYTGSSEYWQTSGAVAAEADRLSDDSRPVIANVRAMYDFVIQKLSYNKDKIKFNIRQGAAKALEAPDNAVCLEYADLLVAMLRSQGIPARMPVGYSYSGSLKESDAVADSLHSWVEAYVPGIGWMTLDPTWGEKFDEFGKSDLERFAFTVWGHDDEAPTAVMLGGQDLNYQYEQAVLSYVPIIQVANGLSSLKVTRHVILPGLSLDQIEAVSGATEVISNNHIIVGSTRYSLGSLAPGQKTDLFRWTVGNKWNDSSSASFRYVNGGKVLTLAQSKTRLDYLPFAGLGILTVSGVSVLIARRRSGLRGQPRPVIYP